MFTVLEGQLVTVRTADNRLLPRRAVTGVVEGHDFLVVWVCTDREWQRGSVGVAPALAIPWPAADVMPYQNTDVTT